MPSIYTPDPTNTAQPADSDYAYLQAGELRAIKQYLAAQLTGLGGPVNPEVLRDRAKNYIANGCCRLAQEGNITITANGKVYGGCDLIFALPSGFSTIAATLLQYDGQATASTFAQGLNATTTGSGNIVFGHRMDGLSSKALGVKTITASAKVFQNTGAAVATNMLLYKPNALDNFSGETLVATGSVVSIASGTWTTVSLSYTTIAADVVNGLGAYIKFDGLGAVTNKDFIIGDFQLVESQYVTPFVCPDLSLVYAAVGRYLELVGYRDNVWINGVDFYDGGYMAFKYQKRTDTLNVITTNPVSGAINTVREVGAAVDRTVTAITANASGVARVQTTGATGNQVGRYGIKATAYL